MNNRIIIAILIIGLLNSYCVSINVSAADVEAPDAYLFLTDVDEIVLDGIIEENEYPDTIVINTALGGYSNNLSWGHNTTHLAIGMVFNCTGWVAIGLGDVGIAMAGADVIMGSVDGDQVTVKDMSSEGYSSPEGDDVSYIQSNNIAGSESSGQTILELIIPLQSNDVDGKDHNWLVNNTYGFFTSFHETEDDFTVPHGIGTHSQSLTVEILSIPAEVKEIQMTMSITNGIDPNILVLETLIVGVDDNKPIKGLEIGFYRKTLYGVLLYGSAITDENGLATTEITIDFSGNITFVALYQGSILIKRSETTETLLIEEPADDLADQEFDDLRDTFNDKHLIRNFLLILLYIVLSILLIMYTTVVFDLYQVYRLRNEKEEDAKE
jgi:hypothetical protein